MHVSSLGSWGACWDLGTMFSLRCEFISGAHMDTHMLSFWFVKYNIHVYYTRFVDMNYSFCSPTSMYIHVVVTSYIRMFL